MDIAIVNNAGLGAGSMICKRLVEMGYRVYALVENIKQLTFAHRDFIPVEGPDASKLQAIKEILEKEKRIMTLILNTGEARSQNFQDLSEETILSDIQTSFTTPTTIIRELLPHIKAFQGLILNVSWNTSSNPLDQGCSIALKTLLNAVFEEVRSSGLSVTELRVESPENEVSMKQLSDAVERVLRFARETIIKEIVIGSQYKGKKSPAIQHNAPLDEYKGVMLPEKIHFPREVEGILTPEPSKRKPSKAQASKPQRQKKESQPKPQPKAKAQPQAVVEEKPVSEEPKKEPKARRPRKKSPEKKSEKLAELPQQKPVPEPQSQSQPQKQQSHRPLHHAKEEIKPSTLDISHYKSVEKKKSTRRGRPMSSSQK